MSTPQPNFKMPTDGNFSPVPVFRHEGISILLGANGIYHNNTEKDKLFKFSAVTDSAYYTKPGNGTNITFNTSDLYGEPVLANEYIIFSLPRGCSIKIDAGSSGFLTEQV
jgi:hypothetical protein